MSEPSSEHDLLAREFVDAGFAVHTLLGPGLLESVAIALPGRQPVAWLPSLRVGAGLPLQWRGKRSDRLDYFSANGTNRTGTNRTSMTPTPGIRSCRSQYRGLSQLWPLSEETGVLAARHQHIPPREPRIVPLVTAGWPALRSPPSAPARPGRRPRRGSKQGGAGRNIAAGSD
jgi:hypothetical protein